MRRPLAIFDLLLFTLIIGVHLAHLPLAVNYSGSDLNRLVPLVPTLAAIWIQLRFRLKTLPATLTHYGVCVIWAFLYGYGYCLTLNARRADQPTRSRMFDPFSWAVGDMHEMAVFALLTSAVYAMVSFGASRVAVRVFKTTGEGETAAHRTAAKNGLDRCETQDVYECPP